MNRDKPHPCNGVLPQAHAHTITCENAGGDSREWCGMSSKIHQEQRKKVQTVCYHFYYFFLRERLKNIWMYTYLVCFDGCKRWRKYTQETGNTGCFWKKTRSPGEQWARQVTHTDDFIPFLSFVLDRKYLFQITKAIWKRMPFCPQVGEKKIYVHCFTTRWKMLGVLMKLSRD